MITMIGKRIEVCWNDLITQREMKQAIWITVKRWTRDSGT
jgi:hypothetical protein